MSLKPRKVNFDEHWQKIHYTVNRVLASNTIDKTLWNDCFLHIYTLCVAFPESYAPRLYDETKNFLKTYVNNLRLSILPKLHDNLLFHYYIKWSKFNEGIKHIQTLFVYLNQQYIRRDVVFMFNSIINQPNNNSETQNVYEIGELGLRMWRKIMLTPDIINQLISLIIICLDDDRKNIKRNEKTAPYIIRECLLCFTTIDKDKIYTGMFEENYIKLCAKYYQDQAEKLLKTNDINSYVNEVTRKLCQESLRSQKYLDPSTENKITQIIMSQMIENHLDYINKECVRIIHNEIEQLIEIYPLLKRVNNGLVKLLDILYEYIIDEGLKLINNNNDYTQFVENILNFHEKYSKIIVQIFNNDKDFNRILDRACAYIINYKTDSKTLCKSPGFLAKYCDNLIKKSISINHDETEFDTKLDGIIIVFRYLDDKDYFHKYYSRLLAKRLIYEQSDMIIEELMITKLKNVCGYEFINKLHRMYTDICLSTDLNYEFSLYLIAKKIYLLNCHIYILQSGAWPLQRIFDHQNYIGSTEFQLCIQVFEQFYSKNYNGKKLQWLFNLSMVDVKLNYLKQAYLLTLSTPHFIILLQFESVEELTVRDILNNTGMIFDDVFKRHLNGLLELKLLLLENQDDITTDQKLQLNLNFSYKRTKLRVSPITQKLITNQQAKIGPDGTDLGVCVSVEKDRKMYLQATIVRIMKMHKQLKHNALIEEIFKQKHKAHFTPTIHLIKSSIETLIEKAYLSRDDKDPEFYNYSA